MSELDLPSLRVVDVPTCCGTPPVAREEGDASHGTLFHFSLNVSDLSRSIDFYRILFNAEPAKRHADYAKFELSQPPLVFSLVPQSPGSSGTLSHFGFPVDDVAEVEATQARLAAAGLTVTCQRDTVCGYARQDKVWVADPDQNFWEIYVGYEDVDPESVRSGFDGIPPVVDLRPASESAEAVPVLWEQRVLAEMPERIPHDDASVDEVRLEGVFNNALTPAERSALLREARRVLKPGGRILVHGLVADKSFPGSAPSLPGVAALARRVPLESEPIDALRDAGFESPLITKLPESAVFKHDGVQMRELKVTALQPARVPMTSECPLEVLYKGPFERVIDEAGYEFVRGRRTAVSAATWQRLSNSAAVGFLFLGDAARDDRSCSG